MKGVLITGGAGFLGSNLAAHLHQRGFTVTVFDNLVRPGSEKNADWLAAKGVKVLRGDVRHRQPFNPDFYGTVFHLAGQVTVTDSIIDPLADFDNNLTGTINVLEVIRKSEQRPKLIFSSTNKVYGRIGYEQPINETQPLDFLSPYGCSKGAADQYVLDYARTYGLRTVVLRQSCIYGERQFGMLGQGWISWFALKVLCNEPITIYGNGKQVRDILYVEDWVRVAVLAAMYGDGVYNIGGGPANSVSVLEAITLLEEMTGKKVEKTFDQARVGDQEYYVSDNAKAKTELNWEPRVGINQGMERLIEWTRQII